MNGTEEEFVPEEEAEEGPAAMKALREKLKKAIEEKQEYLDGWQRARADFANFKREEAQLQDERQERTKAQLAEAIIPALDSFEMAFTSPSFEHADPEWKKGMQALYQGLLDSLERVGIRQFSPLGEPFDPRQHEALREVEAQKQSQDQTIERVERSGYRIGERIIRPAQVSVYSFKQ